MSAGTVQIRIDGRISGSAAEALGGRVVEGDGSCLFVTNFVDQAHLVGLLVQLSRLHLAFDHVVVHPGGHTPATEEGVIR